MSELNFKTDFGIIITAYKQIKLCQETIINFRNNFKVLNQNPIIVVSTSEVDCGFKEFEKSFPNVYVIRFYKANPIERVFHDDLWLVRRILTSIRLGFLKLDKLNVKYALHLHSDTSWNASKENVLLSYIQDVHENKSFLVQIPDPTGTQIRL